MKRLRLILLASASISSVAAADTLNTSSSPTVVAGDATYSVNEAGTVRTITQTTDRVFLDWVDLSVGENETLQFVQPDALSIALNRVTGTTQTIIDGTIEANGRVWILNPNGIFISPTGQVTASGFLASTGSISSTDFMAGGDQFSIGGVSSASVENAGSIATELGYTILHGASITNEGQISATLGAVLLASGNDLSISFDEGNLISYAVSNESTLAASFQGIKNTGTITADGGLIALSMASALDAIHSVINAEGLLQANSVEERNGTIILDAGDHGDVTITGTVTVAGLEADEVGGSIEASGTLITLADTAEVIADGGAGGGSISIFSTATQGSNSSTTIEGNSFVSISESEAFLVEETRIQLANGALADIAIVDGSVISASATVSGSGGTVTIEAPGEEELATFVAGEIRANGVGTDSVGGIIDLSGFYLEIEGSELSVSGATAGAVVLTAASIDLVDQLSASSSNLSFSDFEWQSAETTPLYDPALMTSLNLGDDQVSGRISLGFAFEFFGETYDSVEVSSNGFLSFGDLGSNSRCCNGQPLDDGNAPLLSIFGLWTDLIPNYEGGDVLYTTITNPDGTREFILQWKAVSEYINGQLNTFEIRLRENGDIYLNYGDVSIVQHNVSIGLTGADASQIAQLTYREVDFDNCCTTNIISDISQTAYIFSQGFDPVSQISAATLQNILGSGANLTINARNFTEANRSNDSIGNISVSGPLTLSFGANSSAQEIIFSADNNVSIDSSAVFSNFLGQLRLIAGASDGGQIGSVFAQGLITAGLLEVTGSVIQIGETEAEEIILNVGGEATLGNVTAGTLTSTGLVNLGGSNSTLENLRILSGRLNLSEISGLPSETIYFGNGTLNIANTSLLELDQLVTVDEFGEIIFGASGAFSGSVDALSENTGNLRIASISDLTISGSIGTNRTLEIIDFSSEGDLKLTETARLVSDESIGFFADGDIFIDSDEVIGSQFGGELGISADRDSDGTGGTINLVSSLSAGALEVSGNLVFDGSGEISVLNNSNINGSISTISEEEGVELTLRSAGLSLSVNGSIVFDQLNLETPGIGDILVSGDITATTLTKLGSGSARIQGPNSSINNLRIINGVLAIADISNLPLNSIFFGDGLLDIDIHEPETVDFSESQSVSETDFGPITLTQQITVEESGDILFRGSGIVSGAVNSVEEGVGSFNVSALGDLTITGQIGLEQSLHAATFYSDGDLSFADSARLRAEEFVGLFAHGNISLGSDDILASDYTGQLNLEADQDGDGTGGTINLVESLSAGSIFVSGDLLFSGSGQVTSLSDLIINGDISSEEEGEPTTLVLSSPGDLRVSGSITFNDVTVDTLNTGDAWFLGDLTAETLSKLGQGFLRLSGTNSAINHLRIINGALAISDVSNLPVDSIFFGNGFLDIDIRPFVDGFLDTELDETPVSLSQQITVEDRAQILFRGPGSFSAVTSALDAGSGVLQVFALNDLVVDGLVGTGQSHAVFTAVSDGGDLILSEDARILAETFIGLGTSGGDIFISGSDIFDADFTGDLSIITTFGSEENQGTIHLDSALSANFIELRGDVLLLSEGDIRAVSDIFIGGRISSDPTNEESMLVLAGENIFVDGDVDVDEITLDILTSGQIFGNVTTNILSSTGPGSLRLSGENSAINNLRIINGALAISNLSNLPLNTLFFGNAELFIETEEPVELAQDITVGDYARILFNGSGTMTGPINAENDGEGILEVGAQGDLNFNGTIGADSRLAEIFADSGRRLTLGENAFLSARQIIDLIGVSGFTNLSEREDVLETGAWTVWSGNPDPFGEDNPDIVGSLVHDFRYYGISLAGARGEAELPERPEGNGLAYGLSPVLNAELAEELSRIYDGTTTFSPDLVSLLFSGLVNGDSAIIDIVSATANLPGVDATEAVIAGITANFTDTSGAPVFGYRFQDTITVPAVILPATLTYRADEATRYVGAQNPTFSGTVTGFIAGENLENATTGTLVFTSPADENSDVGLYPIFGGGLSAANYIFVQAVENETALTVQKNIVNEVSSGSDSGSGGSGDGSGDTGSDGGGEGSGDGGSDDSGDGSGDGSEGSGDSGSDEGGDGSEEGGDDAGDSNSDDSDDGSDEGDQGSEDSDESSDEGSEESDEGSEDSDESSDEGSEESDGGSDDAGEGSEESSSDEGSDGSDSTDTSDGAGSDSEADTGADGGTSVGGDEGSDDGSSTSSQQSGGEIVKVEVKPADPLPPSPVGDEPTPTPSDPEDSGDPVLAAVSFEDEASIDTSVGVPQEVVALTPTISVAPQKEAPPAPKSDDEALSINSALNP